MSLFFDLIIFGYKNDIWFVVIYRCLISKLLFIVCILVIECIVMLWFIGIGVLKLFWDFEICYVLGLVKFF